MLDGTNTLGKVIFGITILGISTFYIFNISIFGINTFTTK